MGNIYSYNQLSQIAIDFTLPQIIFLYGDLGAGKTSFVSSQIKKHMGNMSITSPTYVYYNRYDTHYHFDLYRIESYEEFVAIGAEEILENNSGVIFVEWPEIIEPYFTPDITFYFKDIGNENTRYIIRT